jgi:histidyl-tRNA synthetase
MSDVLCADCREHFHDVQNYLNMMRIKFKVNPRLVRGLDYYTKTVFEVISSHLGAQNAVCGGGHYDNLVEQLGGPATSAVGFAFGMERIVMIMQSQGLVVPAKNPFLFFLPLGENAKNRASILANKLRRLGIPLEVDNTDRGLSAKMKYADRLKVEYVYILGEDELVKKHGQLKNMSSGKQSKVTFEKLFTTVEKLYKKKTGKV